MMKWMVEWTVNSHSLPFINSEKLQRSFPFLLETHERMIINVSFMSYLQIVRKTCSETRERTKRTISSGTSAR